MNHLDMERWYKWALRIGSAVGIVSFAVGFAIDPTPPDACASAYAACPDPTPHATPHGAISAIVILGGFLCAVGLSLVIPAVGKRWGSLAISGAREDWLAPAAGSLRLLATFLPAEQGRLWLGEAISCLHEAGPARHAELIRDYRASAPRVILITWTRLLVRASGHRAAHPGER